MLRLVVIWLAALMAGTFAVLAKVARSGEASWVMLAMAVLCFVTWIYLLTTQPAPRDGEPRASVFRLVGLWMRAKEKDLQSRIDQKP